MAHLNKKKIKYTIVNKNNNTYLTNVHKPNMFILKHHISQIFNLTNN